MANDVRVRGGDAADLAGTSIGAEASRGAEALGARVTLTPAKESVTPRPTPKYMLEPYRPAPDIISGPPISDHVRVPAGRRGRHAVAGHPRPR
jgi:hypothetical protein